MNLPRRALHMIHILKRWTCLCKHHDLTKSNSKPKTHPVAQYLIHSKAQRWEYNAKHDDSQLFPSYSQTGTI